MASSGSTVSLIESGVLETTRKRSRWYETLDEDTKQDWDLLREALLERYPPDQVSKYASSVIRNYLPDSF
jgi:hypothetical protein